MYIEFYFLYVYQHLIYTYCNSILSRPELWTNGQAENPITRCPRWSFQAKDIPYNMANISITYSASDVRASVWYCPHVTCTHGVDDRESMNIGRLYVCVVPVPTWPYRDEPQPYNCKGERIYHNGKVINMSYCKCGYFHRGEILRLHHQDVMHGCNIHKLD